MFEIDKDGVIPGCFGERYGLGLGDEFDADSL